MLRNFDNFDDFNLPTRTWGTNNNDVDAKNYSLVGSMSSLEVLFDLRDNPIEAIYNTLSLNEITYKSE